MKLLLLLLVAAFAHPALAGDNDHEKFMEAERVKQKVCADAIEHSLSNATTIELFAIDPSFPASEKEAAKDPRPKLLDWRVVAQTTLADRTAIRALGSALADGIRSSEVGYVVGCFNPRHALRWKADGKEVTVIVCFQCGNGGVIGLEPSKGFLTTKSPQATFERIFSVAGLPKVK